MVADELDEPARKVRSMSIAAFVTGRHSRSMVAVAGPETCAPIGVASTWRDAAIAEMSELEALVRQALTRETSFSRVVKRE